MKRGEHDKDRQVRLETSTDNFKCDVSHVLLFSAFTNSHSHALT